MAHSACLYWLRLAHQNLINYELSRKYHIKSSRNSFSLFFYVCIQASISQIFNLYLVFRFICYQMSLSLEELSFISSITFYFFRSLKSSGVTLIPIVLILGFISNIFAFSSALLFCSTFCFNFVLNSQTCATLLVSCLLTYLKVWLSLKRASILLSITSIRPCISSIM